jgi:hypothetical protein
MTADQNKLRKLVKQWKGERSTVLKQLSQLDEKITFLREKYAAKITPMQKRVGDLEAQIVSQLTAMKGEFTKPKSIELFGVRVGFRKSTDELVFTRDDIDAVSLIEQVKGKKSALLKHTSKPNLAVIKTLDTEALAAIGYELVAGTDKPFAEASDGLEALSKSLSLESSNEKP